MTHQKIKSWALLMGGLFIFILKMNAQPPLFDQWEENMITWGNHWGVYLQTYEAQTNGGMNEQEGIYYDAQRVFFQIADYTGQAEPWNSYAQEAERIYRVYLDVRFNYNGTIPYFVHGWRRFSHGIMMDAQRTADSISIDGILKLRDNGAFANVLISNGTDGWYYERRSREIAYIISAHVNAEKFGYPRQEEALALYISMAMNHLDEWISETYASPDSHRLSPFMIGLTAEALIEFHEWEVENGRDPSAIFSHPSVTHNPTRTIEQALQQVADHMRYDATVESGVHAGKPMWVVDMGGSANNWNDLGGTGYSTLRYESINNASPTPVLNLLIAPLYAWVFKQTADMAYIEIGDKLWETGIALTNVGWNTKTFNQNYRWSFDYIKWRNEGMGTVKTSNNNRISKLAIYPNPTSTVFTIDWPDEHLEKALIYNQLGQQVQEHTSSEVDISNLPNGVYFIKITTQSGQTATKRVFKN